MKIAILVDGGFFDAVNKNRVNGMLPTADHVKQEVENTMRLIRAKTLTDSENIKDVLFRVYFYDARPFSGQKDKPARGRVRFYAIEVVCREDRFVKRTCPNR